MFEAGFTCILSKSLMNTRTKIKHSPSAMLNFFISNVARLEKEGANSVCGRKQSCVTVFADVCVSTTAVVEQVSSLGPKSTDNRLIVCTFLFCLYLCTET